MSHKGVWRCQLSTPPPTKRQHTKAASGISDQGYRRTQIPELLKQLHSPLEQYSPVCHRRSPWWLHYRSPLCTFRSLPVYSDPRGPTVHCPVSGLWKKQIAACGRAARPQTIHLNQLAHRMGDRTTQWSCTHTSKRTNFLNFLDKKLRSNLKICLMVPNLDAGSVWMG